MGENMKGGVPTMPPTRGLLLQGQWLRKEGDEMGLSHLFAGCRNLDGWVLQGALLETGLVGVALGWKRRLDPGSSARNGD